MVGTHLDRASRPNPSASGRFARFVPRHPLCCISIAWGRGRNWPRPCENSRRSLSRALDSTHQIGPGSTIAARERVNRPPKTRRLRVLTHPRRRSATGDEQFRRLIADCHRTVIADACALAFPLSGAAANNVPPETLNVKAFPDRYVVAGKLFADLAALEAWAGPIANRSAWLDFCYPATTRELVSTVERLHSAYSGGMQIRTPHPGEGGCVPAAGHSSPSPLPAHEAIMRADAEYLATDRVRPRHAALTHSVPAVVNGGLPCLRQSPTRHVVTPNRPRYPACRR
jgi:hypothetical protein